MVLYVTKHGATGEVARRIAHKIDGAVLHDLKEGGVPVLLGFDCIIVGSPVYAGMIRKEAKAFLAQNADVLRGKKLGLFLSGLDADKEKACFEANMPPDLLQSAKAVRFLGGIFNPKKAGFMGRFIMKAVAKQSGYSDTIDDNGIAQFAEEIMA